jgi:hypothetical protein
MQNREAHFGFQVWAGLRENATMAPSESGR